MPEIISIREYARRKGFSDTMVHKWRVQGVLTEEAFTTNPKNGRPAIIFEMAERDFAANYSPSKTLAPTQTKKTKDGQYKERKPKIEPLVNFEDEDETEPPPSKAKGTGAAPPSGENTTAAYKSKAEIDRQISAMRLQEQALKLKKEMGKVVDRDKVYASFFAIAQIVRKDFMALPDKCIDDILNADGRHAARLALKKAIQETLEQIADISEKDLISSTNGD